MVAELSTFDWTLLVVAGLMVGFAKTAVGGVGPLAVVLFAVVLPARLSTGAILPLLIAGDLVAVAIYRRHGSARELLRLLPGVVPGIYLLAWFVARVDDTQMTLAIGAILIVMGAVQVAQRLNRSPEDPPERVAVRPLWTVGVGALAGFATMTANAAGPVMALYLIMAGLPMLGMLGTGAWFFLVVNVLKVPLSTSLDLINGPTLLLDALLVPAMLVGAFVGARIVRGWHQRQFELITLTMSIVAAGLLIASA